MEHVGGTTSVFCSLASSGHADNQSINRVSVDSMGFVRSVHCGGEGETHSCECLLQRQETACVVCMARAIGEVRASEEGCDTLDRPAPCSLLGELE